jgi:pSer/pThr/pTyr-binding forkhead associated (FHA) protein
MPVTVLVRSGNANHWSDGKRDSFSLTFDAPVVVIGRGEASEVRLPDPSVSHRHATIRQRGNEYILVDEGSTNGTFMGGVKLGAHAPRILKHRDMARVGRVWLEFRFDNAVPPPQTALATKELALALVARALEAQGEAAGPRIRVVEGPDAGRTFVLEDAGRSYVIGRGSETDFVLQDPDASRHHVQLVRRADQLLARDLGSKNGATLAGRALEEERDQLWRAGQVLCLGQSTIVYEYGAVDALAELERAADERIRPDEPLAPPDVAPPGPGVNPRVPLPSGPQLTHSPSDAAGEGAAPIAELPVGKSRNHASAGWTGTDFIVLLLAIVVLALSAVGLVWLLRG